MNKIACFALTAAVLSGLACATMGVNERLDPESREFLSKTRYIITREESKAFQELPPDSRPSFIEDFWLRRDPTPETEENEFRAAYYRRIEEANRLFRGAKPGWLQDRGRTYIIFGPPNERITNPMGGQPIDPTIDPRDLTGGRRVATGEKGSETWVYYNLFSSMQRPQAIQLVFVDSDNTGDYVLATNLDQLIPAGIDSLLRPNMELTHELYKEEFFQAGRGRRILFDFQWEFIKEENASENSNLTVSVALPYRRIIFKRKEEAFSAEMRLEVQVADAGGNVLWSRLLEETLAVNMEFFKENPNGSWSVRVPVGLRLAKGRYSVSLRLENLSGDQAMSKLLPLKM